MGSACFGQRRIVVCCARPGCFNQAYKGIPGEYCSKRCRDWALLPPAIPICPTPGCGKPTWNGQENEYCSQRCRNGGLGASAPPTCGMPGCGKPTWNGQPGEYCSRSCKDGRRYRTQSSSTPPSTKVPICKRPGCGKPTWNGNPGEFCTRTCRDLGEPWQGAGPSRNSQSRGTASSRSQSLVHSRKAETSSWFRQGQTHVEIDGPCLEAVKFADPRAVRSNIPVVAFYFPGHPEVWDSMCKSSFLGNFFDVGPHGLVLQARGAQRRFQNAEAAFQALKYWNLAQDFEFLSGEDAFKKNRQLQSSHSGDLQYAGFGSSWKAMLAVLRAKFQCGTTLAGALMRTEQAFLLEHNPTLGRDSTWSDNNNGEGMNWLGLQLMLVRDELRYSGWKDWISCSVDLETGAPRNGDWQNAVRSATQALSKALREEPLRYHGRNLESAVCEMPTRGTVPESCKATLNNQKSQRPAAETAGLAVATWTKSRPVDQCITTTGAEETLQEQTNTSNYSAPGLSSSQLASGQANPSKRSPAPRGALKYASANPAATKGCGKEDSEESAEEDRATCDSCCCIA